MDKLLIKVAGQVDGRGMELYEDKVIYLAPGYPPITVYLKDITTVEFSTAGLISYGGLKLGYNNGLSSIHMVYKQSGKRDIEKIRDYILEQQAIFQKRAAEESKKESPPAEDKALSEIKALGELRDKGLLTEDEFQAKKRQILFPGQGGAYVEKQIVREIVKVPCPYCGMLYEITAAKCPSCGAPYKK